MGRGKTPQGLMPDVRARRVAYENRKKGLMKKAREFSVLCDVDTCVVVFPATAAGGDRPTAPPEVWPPDSGQARRIMERYRSTASREAFDAWKKMKRKQLDLGRAGELLRDLSESQLRSLLSTLGDGVDLAKRKLAAVREERRITMAGATCRLCSEGLSIDKEVPQKKQHQVCAAGTPDWGAGAQPNAVKAHGSCSLNGCDTIAMEDDSSFETLLMEFY